MGRLPDGVLFLWRGGFLLFKFKCMNAFIPSDPFLHMQAAVDIVGISPHPVNKIAATLVCADGRAISRTNLWPDAISSRLGTEVRIGNASGTIHAETACILSIGGTDGGAMFVTDPPCPNCMKNIAEAGIKTLYIDHKGFHKDFAQRRGGHFEGMSMRIAERAGISVHVIYRRERKTETILSVSDGYIPADEFPVRLRPVTPKDFDDAISIERDHYAGQPFAMALAHDKAGQSFAFSARAHAAIGYSGEENLESPDGKYSFVLEPVNRLLMAAARKSLGLQKDLVYSSRVPTARELINMIGADLPVIRIGALNSARDIFGPQALRQLTEAGIIAVLSEEGDEHAS